MSAGHHHNHGMPAGYRHVCMMEGPDPQATLSSRRYDALQEANMKNVEEIQWLKALLAANNIPCAPAPKKSASQGLRRSSRHAAQPNNENTLPNLPTEILLRILKYTLTSPNPIIDPFFKLCKENVTKAERSRRNEVCINFMVTCKAFKAEGMRFLFANRTFIFTQVAALDNFSTLARDLRATVKHVNLRIVGRYYDNDDGKKDLTGNDVYHPSLTGPLVMPVTARPPGMIRDKGIQAYCWEQLADFLKALVMPTPPSAVVRPKLFPSLESMQIDLVNFCDHLPYGGYQFGALIRWHLGEIVDELLITGIMGMDHEEEYTNEERVLQTLVRDEGLVGSTLPILVSNSKKTGLRPLAKHHVHRKVLRAAAPSFKSAKKLIHPEGGECPQESSYIRGTTIWKWTSETVSGPKKWIEFDRRTGNVADDVDMKEIWVDLYEDVSDNELF